uniref:Laminin G domain-containing protein n=1 Tax=Amphimedon queenslandica TaxID=400682 RepID=A0A1X7SGF9_AMPQE
TWSLSFSLRRLSGDGHVITVSSKSGVSISIALISNGIIDLRLRGENGSDEHVSADTPLAINTWNNI